MSVISILPYMTTNRNYLLGLLSLLISMSSFAQLNVQIKGGDRQVCENHSLTYTGSIISGTPTSYEWISTVATFTNSTANSTEATFSGSGEVVLKTTDASSTFYDTVYITLNPLPTLNLTTLIPNRFCDMSSNQVLNANQAGGTWSSNDPSVLEDGDIISPANASILYPDTVFFTYNYQSPITGCKNEDSIFAFVDASPVITTPLENEFCRTKGVMSETLQFEVTAKNTDDLTWFNYSHPSRVTLGTIESQNITINYQTDSTETFRIIINADGKGSCASKIALLDIVVHPIPKATLTSSVPVGCNPVTTTLDVHIINQVDSASSTFYWTMGDASNTTASTSSTTATYTTDGEATASLTITSAQGCDTTLSIGTFIDPIPRAEFVANPNNNAPISLPRFQFLNTSSISTIRGSFISAYNWSFGDIQGSTSSEENPSFFYPTDTATYNVLLRVTSNRGCIDSASYPVHVGKPGAVSVSEDYKDNINVYPNPSTGAFTIANLAAYEVQVYNTMGKSINFSRSGDEQIIVASKGVYMLELIDEKAGIRIAKKLVVR